jgi:nucleoid DNA-binding protein
MKKSDIAQQLARESGVSQGEAADQLDEVLSSILKTLKKGRSANLPGLGRLRRDVKGMLKFTPSPGRRPHGAR